MRGWGIQRSQPALSTPYHLLYTRRGAIHWFVKSGRRWSSAGASRKATGNRRPGWAGNWGAGLKGELPSRGFENAGVLMRGECKPRRVPTRAREGASRGRRRGRLEAREHHGRQGLAVAAAGLLRMNEGGARDAGNMRARLRMHSCS